MVDRLVGQLDALPVEGGGDPGHRHRFGRGPGRGVEGQVGRRREPPGAVVEHPDRQPRRLAFGCAFELVVADPHVGVPDALDPQLGVAGARLAGPGQGGVGQRSQGQGGEGRVDLVAGGSGAHQAHGTPTL